jgi:hypothetical protein
MNCGQYWRCAALLGFVALASGCQSYDWVVDYSQFSQAEERAREEDKSMFIFYKSWTDEASNRMLGSEVLSDSDVVGLFQDTINLLVEEAGGPKYMAYMGKYGVTRYPASVIVNPDGTYHVRTGFIPKDEFIEFAKNALKTEPGDDERKARAP